MIKRFKASDPIEYILEALEEEAALIIDDLVEIDLISDVKAEIDPYLSSCESGKSQFSGHNTKRVGALISRSPACRKLAMEPLINKITKKFLN